MDEVIRILHDHAASDPVCSYGASLNVGHKKEDGTVSIANIEISNYNVSVQYYGADHQDSYGCHFNEYLRLNVSQLSDPSSVHRLDRALEMMEQHGMNDVDDIKRILGDTANEQYPVFRSGEDPDDLMTMATGIFDISHGLLQVHENCNPKECDASIEMPFADIGARPSSR